MDKGARDWLGDYLSRYDGTLLVVSHDENLLQAAVSSIAEVRSGNVELYKSRSHDQVFDYSKPTMRTYSTSQSDDKSSSLLATILAI